MRYRWARTDRYRPHRCPRCWKLSPSTTGRGWPRWWFIYRCDQCQLRWFRLGGLNLGEK